MAAEYNFWGDALVIRSAEYPHRWYDALGRGVIKYLQDFVTIPSDDTTGDPTEWEVTVVEAGAGDSTAVVTDVLGGALLVTTAANEDDGWSMQLGAAAGECVSFASRYPTYFGATFQINDVDQTDVLVGFTVTDTAALGGVTDGMYFRSVDATGVLNFVLEKNSVETVTAVATMTDDADIVAEFFYDAGSVKAYINGALVATIADSDVCFPNDELLRLTFEFLTGEAVANTCLLGSLRFIQIQE